MYYHEFLVLSRARAGMPTISDSLRFIAIGHYVATGYDMLADHMLPQQFAGSTPSLVFVAT